MYRLFSIIATLIALTGAILGQTSSVSEYQSYKRETVSQNNQSPAQSNGHYRLYVDDAGVLKTIKIGASSPSYVSVEARLLGKGSLVQGGVTGSGASDQVAVWSGTSTITGDNNFKWSGTNQQLTLTGKTYSVGSEGDGPLSITKGTRTTSALDIHLDGTGKAMRFFNSGGTARSYFNDEGMFYTNGWMVISGDKTGSGGSFTVNPPTTTLAYMLGIWSDVGANPSLPPDQGGGPEGVAIVARASGDSTGHNWLFQGMDKPGNYTFSIEVDGKLRWGASNQSDPISGTSHDSEDTSLWVFGNRRGIPQYIVVIESNSSQRASS